MFFKRKQRNRRHSRGYVLDVKLSASRRRETRLRRLTLFLSSSLILFLTVFIVWRGGEFLLRRFVFENQAFAIRGLQIETDGVLSTEQIRTWAGVRMGDNLLALDMARVERDLKLVPAIGERSKSCTSASAASTCGVSDCRPGRTSRAGMPIMIGR